MKCPNCNYELNLISVKDFADAVGVHRRTVENRIKAGELDCIDTSLGMMIPAELIKTFERKRGAKGEGRNGKG